MKNIIKKIIGFMCLVVMILFVTTYVDNAQFTANAASTYTVKLSDSKLTYNNEVQYPKVIVKNKKGKKLKEGTDYTLKYSEKSKSIGAYTVKVKMKGSYSGNQTLKYSIVPKNVTELTFEQGQKAIKVTKPVSVTAYDSGFWEEYRKKGYAYVYEEIDGVQLSWKKVSGVTGYRIYVEKNGKWEYLATSSKTQYTVKNLTPGKVYKFAVRAYKEVDGTRYLSKTYTSISAASRPNKTTPAVKIKNNKAYITWDKKTCSGYYLYVKCNDGDYKKIDIKGKNTTSYIYEYPGYAYSIKIKIKTYTKTDNGKIYSDASIKTLKVTPFATKTDSGIKLKPVTSKTAKSIVKSYFWPKNDAANYLEGTSANGKRIVVYSAYNNGKWYGYDARGVYYNGDGKTERCVYCGKLLGQDRTEITCSINIRCYISFS